MASTPKPAGVSFSNTSLDALQNEEQASLMDLVDKLRRNGASAHLQLPQIVVCGDQSSGKSSTLEALTGIPFPRKENLCTRFATEISMRRDAIASISCQINPGDSRSDDEKAKFREFSKTITDFFELPDIIDETTNAMGLGRDKAFSEDSLSIVICTPDSPQLTVVDLPGLIHSSNKSQSEADVELIKNLVKTYIEAKRTIILAVVSAKNDYANQIILKMCREVDPTGSRTLGVITKPDFLRAGSENEKSWLELAQNQDIVLDLGWHLLKNLGDGDQHLSSEERDATEAMFFASGNYDALPSEIKGIPALRLRLSRLLFDHLRRELPKLKKELDHMVTENDRTIAGLGPSRASLIEQKAYLAELLHTAYEIIERSVRGSYEGPFFAVDDDDATRDAKESVIRLRARVQLANFDFSKIMLHHGHKYDVDDDPATDSAAEHGHVLVRPEVIRHSKDHEPGPIKMSHEDAIQWVVGMLQRNRGSELPGMFNPLIVSHLFWRQSEPWERIASNHVMLVARTCRVFLDEVLKYCVSDNDKPRIKLKLVEPALKQALEGALKELKSIMEDKAKHPITYNHCFTDTLQKLQRARHEAAVLDISKKCTRTLQLQDGQVNHIDPARLNKSLKNFTEHDMDRVAALQALDAQMAFYEDERKYFVDVVAKQVIERHLLSPLPTMLSSRVMAGLNDKEVQYLVAEPAQTTRLRERLQSKKAMLEDSQQAFALAMGE